MRQWRSLIRRGGNKYHGNAMRNMKPSPLAFSTFETSKKPFDKILISNRGEIACRVIRTAKKLGIQTVALYSDMDGPGSLHAQMADEAVKIGYGPSPSESYLLGDEVLNIAAATGAQAIHPGYGFLSENSTFASSAMDAGITFIGPPPSAIMAMGSKSHSKVIMDDAGVPTTPGYHGDNQDAEYLKHEAVHNVGFPLLIKATMGGGGKGMRLVWDESEFLSALESAKRESVSAFGDSNVILERYLVNPRHIEVQVMVDSHGNAVYLHERDCSLQRRHQKVIEEAPASDLPHDLRSLMGETAVKAALAVSYVNAGTVEFLLDQNDDSSFYFCEMNTRLQVEHPVTEMITNQDLVEWQLRIAAGEELPIQDQSQIPCIGHAFEARIYSEDPTKDFFPATGKVWHHRPPATPNVGMGNDASSSTRVDTGIAVGKDISVHYDPMISKLIVHGDNRDDALKNLVQELKNYQIAGVPSNIPFLIKCAQHPVFGTAGATNTGFLEEFMDDVRISECKPDSMGAMEKAVCAFVVSLVTEKKVGSTKGVLYQGEPENGKAVGGPWSGGSWRLGPKYQTLLNLRDQEGGSIKYMRNDDGASGITIMGEDGKEGMKINGFLSGENNLSVMVDGVQKKSFTVVYNEDTVAGTITVNVWPSNTASSSSTSHFEEDDGAFSMTFDHPSLHAHRYRDESKTSLFTASGCGRSYELRAPMPGKIVRINFEEGASVNENDVLIVMEAMKMEHSMTANMQGVVSKINCEVGDIVGDSDALATVTEDMDEEELESDSESA